MLEWQDYFESHILERGKEYYLSGCVARLRADDQLILAEVFGTELYEVEIALKQGKVVEEFCNCPHFAAGFNCKHLAAVLFAYTRAKEKNKPLTPPKRKGRREVYQKLVDQLDEADMRQILHSLMVDDTSVALFVKNVVSDSEDDFAEEEEVEAWDDWDEEEEDWEEEWEDDWEA